jgi:hypothetical protein
VITSSTTHRTLRGTRRPGRCPSQTQGLPTAQVLALRQLSIQPQMNAIQSMRERDQRIRKTIQATG